MAFLKSSQITGLSAKDVDVRGFTQADSINLDGSYTDHEVLLADAYNIKGNVTVSDDLILSKLSDDGNAITITGDTTTRTISGSGSIQGATLAQTPNANLTGMTGELGSAVTGGSGLTALGTVTSGTLASGTSLNWGGCKVYKTSNQTISNATTTQVTFDTALHDTLSEYSTGTSKYTAKYAGIYIMNSTLLYIDMGDTKDLIVYILVNDSRIGSFDHKSSSANYESVACTTIHKLNANDIVHINTRHAHGSNRDLSGYERVSQFSIQRIG